MEELRKVIERFGKNNEQIKSLKKVTDEDNKVIKSFMAGKMKTAESDNFIATYSVVKSESFDDDKLLTKLKELGLRQVIKTVEVVDMELLENAIYDGMISGSELADCKVTKETAKLVVKLKKKEKK